VGHNGCYADAQVPAVQVHVLNLVLVSSDVVGHDDECMEWYHDDEWMEWYHDDQGMEWYHDNE
jgi:hypothetical protein